MCRTKDRFPIAKVPFRGETKPQLLRSNRYAGNYHHKVTLKYYPTSRKTDMNRYKMKNRVGYVAPSLKLRWQKFHPPKEKVISNEHSSQQIFKVEGGIIKSKKHRVDVRDVT